jgi:hypothetical protein
MAYDTRSSFVWDIMQRRLVVTDVSGPIGCHKTSGNDYQYKLRHIPEEWRSRVHHGRSLNSLSIEHNIGTQKHLSS